MNDKPILYEDKIKDRDNEFLYNKCINQYHQLMNCQCKNKEYKNKINNLQSKIDKVIELGDKIIQEHENLVGLTGNLVFNFKQVLNILKEDK